MNFETRQRLYRTYTRLQTRIAPGLDNSHASYRQVLQRYVRPNARWLDLGCGHDLLPSWLPRAEEDQAELASRCKEVVGVDADAQSIKRHKFLHKKVVGDIQRLPFRSDSFDLVTANMVVEHTEHPSVLLREVWRVLVGGGCFLFHTPNLSSYSTVLAAVMPAAVRVKLAGFLQNRREEDVYPTYYRLNTAKAIKSAAAAAGFALTELQMLESSAQTIMLGPLVAGELLLIRLLRSRRLEGFRTNIIAVLQKTASAQELPEGKAAVSNAMRGSGGSRTST